MSGTRGPPAHPAAERPRPVRSPPPDPGALAAHQGGHVTLQPTLARRTPPGAAHLPGEAVDEIELATAALFKQMHDPWTGEATRRRLRARIIELNLPFAARLAHRYCRRGQAADDLEQVAALALVKAVDRFDPGREKPFFGYLIPTVVGELKRHFRDRCWDVHVSR